jgi:YjbE family integral membrane protein
VLTLFAVALLTLPWLKLVGAVLLLYIGVKLLVPEDGGGEVRASDSMMGAIKTILIADLVMSTDNVIAVAAAAGGHWLLLVIGLAISIPLVIYGATLLLRLMERWPIIITVGAGLLGYVAGEMAWQDPAIAAFTQRFPGTAHHVAAVLGALFVVVLGRLLAGRSLDRAAEVQREHLEAVEHRRVEHAPTTSQEKHPAR